MQTSPRVLATLVIAAVTPLPAHQGDWRDREFGIGVVTYAAMESYEARDVIRTSPSPHADTLAVLARDSLCFHGVRPCVRSYDRMIEYAYEVPGWAILGLTADSGWARVTLEPSDPRGPAGWVRLRGDSVRAVLWSEILPNKALFFLRQRDIAFYRSPSSDSLDSRQLVPATRDYDVSSHLMHPLATRGRWLKVELSVPSNMCEPPPRVRRDTVWVEYLTPAGRPRVFYYTRGC